MRIEWMIYVYGAVCLSMIVFNILYNLALRRSEPRLEERCRRMAGKVEEQLEAIRCGRPVSERHLEELQHKLVRVKNLIAFERVLKPLVEREEDRMGQEYLEQIQPMLLYLAVVYRRRENMQAAYFSYFLSHYLTRRQMQMDSVQELLLDYVSKENLYCRVNAMQALYTVASTGNVLKALQIQDQGEVFIHEKILTEGLLHFSGDHDALIALLWERFDTFHLRTQLGILNYIRFQSGRYTKPMLELMQDRERDKELRLAAVRYFGRYFCAQAQEPLLAFLADPDPAGWEYAAVSASALARYPGQEVVQALKAALHSANWYVRYNASVSLETLEVDFGDVIDIMAGKDRYAREMMMYRLESRNLLEKEERVP